MCVIYLQNVPNTFPPAIVSLDLTDITSLPDKVNEIIEKYGHIDILINNGGISVRSDIMSTAMDVDIKVMLVNYFGTVAMTKAVLPSMIKRKEGRIVCVSSVQGKFAIPYRSSYTASKHALQAFCDSLRAEMDEHNIQVTVVSPGYINTALSMNALTGNGKAYGGEKMYHVYFILLNFNELQNHSFFFFFSNGCNNCWRSQSRTNV